MNFMQNGCHFVVTYIRERNSLLYSLNLVFFLCFFKTNQKPNMFSRFFLFSFFFKTENSFQKKKTNMHIFSPVVL